MQDAYPAWLYAALLGPEVTEFHIWNQVRIYPSTSGYKKSIYHTKSG